MYLKLPPPDQQNMNFQSIPAPYPDTANLLFVATEVLMYNSKKINLQTLVVSETSPKIKITYHIY